MPTEKPVLDWERANCGPFLKSSFLQRSGDSGRSDSCYGTYRRRTAALLFTAGTVAQIPSSLFGSGRTLALHMYALSNEGLHVNEAYATAVVLLVLVLLINGLSNVIAGNLQRHEV